MQILTYDVPSNYDLVLFGDSHEGSSLQFRDGYLQAIGLIRSNRNTFAIHMGDEIEAYWIDDPRYRPEILSKSPLLQQEQVIQDLKPIAKKLITILYGNHSNRLFPKVGDITASTCERLGIRYGGFACVIHFQDKHGIQFKGFFTHGRRYLGSTADDPVRQVANMHLQLKRHLKNKAGDCLLMARGHSHRLLICEPLPTLYLVSNPADGIKQKYTHNPPFGKGGYVHPDHRWYINTGSFVKTFGEGLHGYGELMEYDPVELGYVVVEVRDRAIIQVRKEVVWSERPQ